MDCARLLATLKQNNATATFFVNGNNWGCAYDSARVQVRSSFDSLQGVLVCWLRCLFNVPGRQDPVPAAQIDPQTLTTFCNRRLLTYRA